MKSNVWAKTILTVYRYLERIAGAIDKLVSRQAINSYYSNFTNASVVDVANKIIELGERKVKLINIKVLTEKALKEMDESYAKLLVEKYVHSFKGDDIASMNNLATRTYFRRLTQAENNFNCFFASKGYSDKKLKEYLKDEKWIMDVYYKFQLGQDEEFACAVNY